MKSEMKLRKLNRLQLIEIMLEQERKIAELENDISKLNIDLQFKEKLIAQNESVIQTFMNINNELKSQKAADFGMVTTKTLEKNEEQNNSLINKAQNTIHQLNNTRTEDYQTQLYSSSEISFEVPRMEVKTDNIEILSFAE